MALSRKKTLGPLFRERLMTPLTVLFWVGGLLCLAVFGWSVADQRKHQNQAEEIVHHLHRILQEASDSDSQNLDSWQRLESGGYSLRWWQPGMGDEHKTLVFSCRDPRLLRNIDQLLDDGDLSQGRSRLHPEGLAITLPTSYSR